LKKDVIVIGAGGHSKVVIDGLKKTGYNVVGITDLHSTNQVLGINVIGNDDVILKYSPHDVLLANGIGSVGRNDVRKRIFQFFKSKGYKFVTLIHPSAVIGEEVILHEGVQVMAGAIIQAGVEVGENTIINTGASIDHDCSIGAHVHIAPRAVLAGAVTVQEDVHIGLGAAILQNIKIGKGALVGAGTVVLKNVENGMKVVGVPGREVGFNYD
jgi:sugar O-acyltransferase (sialic acid O-acetyltransferase NeuD family)